MQVKMFTIPMLGGDEANEVLNRYLRGQRVVTIDKQFCIVGDMGYWTFCVTVADSAVRPSYAQGERREGQESMPNTLPLSIMNHLNSKI